MSEQVNTSEGRDSPKPQPTSETLRRRVVQIEEAIAQGQQSNIETRTQIAEVRVSLDMPDNPETPPSIQATIDRNARLEKEKRSIGAQLVAQDEREPDRAQESTAEKVREILKRREVGSALGRLARSLMEREEHHLTPLIHPDDIQRLRGALRNLENLVEQHNSGLDDIEDVYNVIRVVFAKMNEPSPRSSTLREDPESLRRVAHNLRNIGAINNEMASRIGSIDESPDRTETLRLRTTLQKINELAEQKFMQIRRLIEAVELIRI